MNGRKILLIEPPYKNKYPPIGLMKLATYFRMRGDDVRFFKGNLKTFAANLLCDEFLVEMDSANFVRYYDKFSEYIKTGKSTLIDNIPHFCGSENEAKLKNYHIKYLKKDFQKFDIVGVTTLFTFYWKKTIETINIAKMFVSSTGKLIVGGIASTILPEQMEKDTGIKPIKGLLNQPGMIDKDSQVIIDELPLDYSILEEIDYLYPASNAYFAYMTRGCPNKCPFCAVPRLEPQYCDYIGIKEQLDIVSAKYGPRKDLLLMDNNVFASICFDKIIDEIKDCGFQKGATYEPANEYEIALSNLKAPLEENRNIRAYTKKIINIYDEISQRIIDEKEQGNFYLARENARLLYPIYATRENILAFDEVVRPWVNKFFKRSKRRRVIDFNQGVDARLVTDANMEKLSEIAIRPLRIAFDHYEMRDIYIKAIKTATRHGIKDLSNYLLYNFQDKPEDLYKRMRINVDLCEELGATIFSFPMKYHPIDDPLWFNNRDYIGPHWNRKFIRAIQAVLNSTKGKIGRGKAFFEEAFGRNVEEFYKILWMPEAFIIYRRKYDKVLRERLSEKYSKTYGEDSDLANEWWNKFSKLDPNKLEIAKSIIALNKFKEGDYLCDDADIEEVLCYYKISRNMSE